MNQEEVRDTTNSVRNYSEIPMLNGWDDGNEGGGRGDQVPMAWRVTE